MPGLKEKYNSQNPELVLEPENGWYLMYLTGEDPRASTTLTIGIVYSESHGEWGYWDYNDATRQKEWVKIDVPESDPQKVRRLVPYTAEEAAYNAQILESVRTQLAILTKLFPPRNR